MQNFLTTPLPPFAYPLLGIGIVAIFALRGFLHGVFRESFSLVSLAAAYFLAQPFGIAMEPFLPLEGMPQFLAAIIASAAGGTAAYVLVRCECFLITRLFRLRRHWEGRKKWIIRSGGALLGAAFGVAIVLLISWFILLMGKLTTGIPGFDAVTTGAPTAASPSASASLVTLPARIVNAHYGALEVSPLGTIAEETSPVPEEVNAGIDIASIILRDPSKMQKLIEYEPVTEILQQETIANLMQNAELQQMAKDGKLLELLNHPTMQAALEDPALQNAMREINVQELLKMLETN